VDRPESEGLSGILSEQDGAWFYKRNLREGRFGPVEMVSTKPSTADLEVASSRSWT
jgi:hypothetical protein